MKNGYMASLPAMAINNLKSCKRRCKVADTTMSLNAKEVVIRATVLRNLLLRRQDRLGERVGVLLPPSVAAATTNLSLTVAGRITVNLNYALGSDFVNRCVEIARLGTIVTSRRFLSKTKLDVNCRELIYLEDLKREASRFDRLRTACRVYLSSTQSLMRYLGIDQFNPCKPATILFTSGSTGEPKGVVLTHANIGHNLAEIKRVGKLEDKDVLLGVLPFFHSFGFTASLWATLTQDITGVFHFHPLEASVIGKLAECYKATIFHSTPTFLRQYLKRIKPHQFADVNFVLSGGEPLPNQLADEFETKFGIRPMDSYGATECAPLISLNVPTSRSEHSSSGIDRLEGSVGKPARNVDIRILDVENESPCPVGKSGVIHVRGPNVMLGYFERDDLTRKVLKDGWYDTGDIGHVDSDGFLFVTGRLSRFSKIGGEMIPHVAIETVLSEYTNETNDDQIRIGVTSVRNIVGEENIVVLYNTHLRSVDAMIFHLAQCGFPNSFIPKPKNFFLVDKIPTLPTGKLDLQMLKTIASEKVV